MMELTPTSVYLVVGLGNPGRDYKHNRHNIGFMILDRLAARFNESFGRWESRALVAMAKDQGMRLILAKPQTYMNDSGIAIGALARFYKVSLSNMIVAYDDVDLPFGTLRLRPSGGSAGQKGMQSIIERVGAEDFPRLRFGIGRPPGRMEAAAYVLQNFNKEEQAYLPQLLDRAVDAIMIYIHNGIERAMTLYNGPSIGDE